MFKKLKYVFIGLSVCLLAGGIFIFAKHSGLNSRAILNNIAGTTEMYSKSEIDNNFYNKTQHDNMKSEGMDPNNIKTTNNGLYHLTKEQLKKLLNLEATVAPGTLFRHPNSESLITSYFLSRRDDIKFDGNKVMPDSVFYYPSTDWLDYYPYLNANGRNPAEKTAEFLSDFQPGSSETDYDWRLLYTDKSNYNPDAILNRDINLWKTSVTLSRQNSICTLKIYIILKGAGNSKADLYGRVGGKADGEVSYFGSQFSSTSYFLRSGYIYDESMNNDITKILQQSTMQDWRTFSCLIPSPGLISDSNWNYGDLEAAGVTDDNILKLSRSMFRIIDGLPSGYRPLEDVVSSASIICCPVYGSDWDTRKINGQDKPSMIPSPLYSSTHLEDGQNGNTVYYRIPLINGTANMILDKEGSVSITPQNIISDGDYYYPKTFQKTIRGYSTGSKYSFNSGDIISGKKCCGYAVRIVMINVSFTYLTADPAPQADKVDN